MLEENRRELLRSMNQIGASFGDVTEKMTFKELKRILKQA